MRWLLLIVIAVSAVGCGPRKAEATPSQTFFWRAKESKVDFSSCTDDPAFRDSIKPLEIKENSYFVYKVAKDGKTATTQTCTRLDTSSCTKADDDFDFEVAGTELIFSESLKKPITGSTCKIQFNDTWTFSDEGETGKLQIGEVISLVDDMTECNRLEQDLIKRSPNMTGVQGCTVRFEVTFSYR